MAMKEVKNLIIYTVGGTPEPIIKSILTYKPEICYFICSRESEPLTNKILDEARIKDPTTKVESHIEIVKNHEDVIECYRTAHQTLKEAKEKYPSHIISIDYTGGTKSMTAGLALAGAKFGIGIFKYIGGEMRDPVTGRVITGYEKPLTMNNPFQEFVIEDLEDAATFFNTYHFEAAEKIFRKCYEKISDPRIKLAAEMAHTFGHWDAFQYEQAVEAYAEVMKLIEEMANFEILSETFKNTLTNMGKSLNRLWYLLGQKHNPAYDCELSALDMVCNAERRIESGRYDDALIRGYRAIEMIIEAKIEKEHKIQIWRREWESDFGRLYPEKAKILSEKLKDETKRLYQENILTLLEVLESPLLRILSDKKFDIDNLRIRRNKLRLIHGIRCATKSDAEGCLKISKQFISSCLQLTLEQLEEQLKTLRFPKLSPEHLIL